MTKYHKIQTVFKRDPSTNMKTLLDGQFSLPCFEYLKDNEWCFTEKVDGTNIRIILDEDGLRVGGRTDAAQIPANLVTRLNQRFDESVLRQNFSVGTCLYGEGYGAKIQKGGGNYRQDQDFVLFDVKVGPWWLKREDVEDVAKKLGLDVVPIVGRGTLKDMVNLCKPGFASNWGNFQAEGVVARPAIELQDRNGSRIITKLKCKDFAKVQ